MHFVSLPVPEPAPITSAAMSPPYGTPFSFYQPQFSSLYGWQTRGNSNYNGLQVSLRHAMSAGLQFDINYTYSKSIDVGSNAERVNGFESGGLAYNSQVINAFSPNLWRAVSDYDTTHQFNANWVWDLPFGKGRYFGGNSNSVVNAIFGGWGLNGLWRWTSGFPFTVEAGAGWATDFELEGSSVLDGPETQDWRIPGFQWRSHRIQGSNQPRLRLRTGYAGRLQLPRDLARRGWRNATTSAAPASSVSTWAWPRRGTSVKPRWSASRGKFST